MRVQKEAPMLKKSANVKTTPKRAVKASLLNEAVWQLLDGADSRWISLKYRLTILAQLFEGRIESGGQGDDSITGHQDFDFAV